MSDHYRSVTVKGGRGGGDRGGGRGRGGRGRGGGGGQYKLDRRNRNNDDYDEQPNDGRHRKGVKDQRANSKSVFFFLLHRIFLVNITLQNLL